MKAVVKTDTGLQIADRTIPQPSATEILVKVRASSLNRADLYLLEGRTHGSAGGTGTVLGLEWAGDVVEVGSAVKKFKKGDKVMCSGIGGLAEYAVTDWRKAFPFPSEHIGYDAAACLTVALRTMHAAIVGLGELKHGQSVVVLGASSGVGLMGLQVAKLLGAGLVIGTSTKADRRARLTEFGADVTLNSTDHSWVKEVLRHTQDLGADLLIDFLAGPSINDSMHAVRIGGRIVNVGRMAGESGNFDFDLHSLRRIQYFGQTFRTRTAEEIGEIADQIQADFWPALVDGKLTLPIDAKFPLDSAELAFEMMRTNGHFGKIVLTQS